MLIMFMDILLECFLKLLIFRDEKLNFPDEVHIHKEVGD